MLNPSILQYLQQYSHGNESTSDEDNEDADLHKASGWMTFNSIAAVAGRQQWTNQALLRQIQQDGGSLKARDEDSSESSEEESDDSGNEDSICDQLQSHLHHDSNIKAASTNTDVIDAIYVGIADKSANRNEPPTAWAKSKAKQSIIDALKDETSDIHLSIGFI